MSNQPSIGLDRIIIKKINGDIIKNNIKNSSNIMEIEITLTNKDFKNKKQINGIAISLLINIIDLI